MLAIPVVITTTMAFAIVAAIPQTLLPIGKNDTATTDSAPTYPNADFTFLPPTLEPYIHVEFLTNYPTNTSTPLGLIALAPNEGGNVTGAITGTLLPIGAAYEQLPGGASATRAIYTNRWSINTTSPTDESASFEDNDDGSKTVIMNAHAFIQYSNAAVFAQGAITFEGRPETNLSYEAFVGQVTSDFGTGRGLLDVFKVVPAGRVDGEPITALLPPGEA